MQWSYIVARPLICAILLIALSAPHLTAAQWGRDQIREIPSLRSDAIQMLLVCVLLAGLRAPAQPTADGEVWTAAVAQVCPGCVIIAETVQPQELRSSPQLSAEESVLLKSLVQRNAAPGVIRNIKLPPWSSLVALATITTSPAKGDPWESFAKKFSHAVMLRLSLPGFSQDGTNAIVYYEKTVGFDDSRGGWLIFEKKQGRWVLVKELAHSIT